jgi:hypothetical protein
MFEQAKTAVVKTYPIAKRGGVCLIAAHMLLRQARVINAIPSLAPSSIPPPWLQPPAVVKTFFINSLIFNGLNP